MIVYSVNNQDGTNTGSAYFAKLKEARECARATAKGGQTCVVEWHETARVDRDLVAHLLNGEGWCSETRELERWEPVKMTKEHEELYEDDEFKVRRVDLRKKA